MLTYADLEERWGVRQVTLRQWLFIGRLPPPDKRIGRSPVWTEETIERTEHELGLNGSG